MVALSVVIAIAAAYGGLRAFLARRGGLQLLLSAIAFGVAVSGMHYTAMAGMEVVPLAAGAHHHLEGLVASPQTLSLVVAVLCFVIAAGFLLSLVPDFAENGFGCRRGNDRHVGRGCRCGSDCPEAAAGTPWRRRPASARRTRTATARRRC